MPPFEPANRPRISAMTLRRRALLLLAPALLLPACGRKKPAATRVPADGVVIETLSGKLKMELAAISKDLTLSRFPEDSEEKK